MNAERIRRPLTFYPHFIIGNLESDRDASRNPECGRDLRLPSSQRVHHHGNERSVEGAECAFSSCSDDLAPAGDSGRQEVQQGCICNNGLNLVVLDGVYLDVKDLEGFEKECLEVKLLV